MRIINKTKWKTDQLRAIAWEVARRERDASERKCLRVEFRSSPKRMTGSSGSAWYRRIVVRVPAKQQATNDIKLDLAITLAHEFHHVLGGPSGRSAEIHMRRSIRYGRPHSEEDLQAQQEMYKWVFEMPLERMEKETSKPNLEALEKKAVAIDSKIRKWTRVAKTASTKLKKYQRQFRRLERSMAAMKAPRDSGI